VKYVGDVMHDSILYYSNLADQNSTILQDLGLSVGQSVSPNSKLRTLNLKSQAPNSELQTLNLKSQAPNSELQTPNYYLVTLHRAENTDNPERLKSIQKALEEISRKYPVILPLHPRTKKMMEVHGLRLKSENVKWIDPVSYLNMLKLEKNAKAILTDSGGVQKEAYWLRVPCITLREVTEWGYTVEEGWNTVAGWRTAEIVRAVQRMPDRKKTRRRGDEGKQAASEKIVRFLFEYFGNRKNHL